MKMRNLFKSKMKAVEKTNFEKLEKKQLEKVVGGLDTTNSNLESNGRVISPMAGAGR